MFVFLLAVALTMLTVLGGVVLLMGTIALLLSWKFWAVLFCFIMLCNVINWREQRRNRI